MEEESNSTTCLEYSLFDFCLTRPSHHRGALPALPSQGGIPYLQLLPPLTCLTASQPLRPRHSIIQKTVPGFAQHAQALARWGATLLFVGEHCACRPSPHWLHITAIWVFLFPKREWAPTPWERAISICSSMQHGILQNILSLFSYF